MNNSPKCKHYEANGTGRDMYISTNNGGFTINNMASPQPKIERVVLSNKFKFQQAGKASIEPKPVRYRSNGSGRDSYIEASGHYIKQRRNVFESNLRNYEKSNNQSFGRSSQ